AYMVFFNVILSYGMETAFFRFYNSESNKKDVIQTSTISVFWTSIGFLFLTLFFKNTLSSWINVEVEFVTYAIWILVLDALVIIPFSKLRAEQRPIVYAVIKIGNVIINMALNVFFLIYLPSIAQNYPNNFLATFYFEGFQIGYIFL